VEQVTSRSNAIVRRFREVAREGRIGDAVLLDGVHLVDEALTSGVELLIVAFSADAVEKEADLVRRCIAAGARVVGVPNTLAASMSPVRQPSGVVALARLAAAELSGAIAARPPQLVVLLDAVQDPGNVGAILRTAEALGATAAVAGPGTADPFGWKALRGSMGSAFRVPVALADDLRGAIATLRRAGIRVFATVPRGGTSLHAAALTAPSAIVVGGEGAGLSAELLTQADERLTIDMQAGVESLNVSVAAALVLYEASRQRAHVAVR
jgi:RNA methyltransferase, TrmH family